MEKIQGKITGKNIESGISKVGKPYTRCIYLIDDQKYSTFDDKIIKDHQIGDCVEMEGEQVGAFWNMKTMKGIPEDKIAEVVKIGAKKDNGYHNGSAMYVSYAKDIFCNIFPDNQSSSHDTLVNNMKCAIDLVKQAKEAFS